MVDVELHPSFKNELKKCMHKTFLFYVIYSLGAYNRSKTRPRRPRIKFKEIGCNSVWVQYQVNQYIYI